MNTDVDTAQRQRWMGTLACATPTDLEQAWSALSEPPAYELLRRPEIGLVMLRGRVGGTGAPFNLGEMTVTRCAVRLVDGRVGHAYLAGRRQRQAEIAALADALLQDPARRPALIETLLAPLEAAAAARRRDVATKAAATRVEFFTVAREGAG